MPNSRQVTPDAADDDRDAARTSASTSNNNNNNQNQMEQDVAVGAQPAAAVRRDENAISFRHFLQPHSDVVPAPPPTCRSRTSRGPQPGSVDLVDMTMALPDFVQDHLVMESISLAAAMGGDHQNDAAGGGGGASGSQSGASSVDLNVLNEILPDFAASSQPHPHPSRRRNESPQMQNPPVAEVHPHPHQQPSATGGPGGGGPSSSASALPDFLSDGPMQCATGAEASSSAGASAAAQASSSSHHPHPHHSHSLSRTSGSSASFDSSESLRSEVDRLRRDVAERNRRISQLEGDVVRLRTNVNVLECALRSAEQNFQESEARRIDAERRANAGGGGGDGSGGGGAALSLPSGFPAQEVQGIAESSQALISQLLQNMHILQGLAAVVRSDEAAATTASQNQDENREGAGAKSESK